ncbi:flagellar protein FliT [Chitinasiproducens palmae]|uniref:Flagellar protein FliT n=1 Tax=Chitinasiproducens palmae TaxID=1770053 RepID=A0A1H2PLM4_9BURK|nr:flagellar protein FliT [Chitinasiproducens palmae]SDV46577.1 flagellar protein FliT [Chitinasiproducens palmae]
MSDFQHMMVRYEALADMMQEMRQAADSAQWDWLASVQSRYSGLVDALRLDAVDDGSDRSAPLNAQERARKHDVIRRILDDDAKIRDLLHPELARLSALLATGRQGRAMQSAYGARRD